MVQHFGGMETLLWIESASSCLQWHSPRRCLGHRQVERRPLQELGTESRSVSTPCFFPVFLTDVFPASSYVTPFHLFYPTHTATFGFAACDCGIYIYPYTCVCRFLSAACCQLIQKRACYLCFLCPGTHAAHGPAQRQLVLVVVSSLPPAGLLSYVSEMSPLEFGWRQPLSSSWNCLLHRLE